jgi:O-antigen ligase
MGTLGLLLSLLFSTVFIVIDCRRRKSVSAAVWVPTILLLILGSRHVSTWAAGGHPAVDVMGHVMGNENDASPLDTVFYGLVLAASLFIATARGINFLRVIRNNIVLSGFYSYWVISVSWSGDPMGSTKRVVKDFCLLFIAGVFFSEKDPMDAMRAVYIRCAAVLFPLSMVFIKWFPNLGRDYTAAGNIMITGVTEQKNTLGEIILVSSIFLVWDQFEQFRRANVHFSLLRIPWDRAFLLLLGLWLLHLSDSKSALLCTIIGIFLVARSGWLASPKVSRMVLAGALALPVLLFFSHQFDSLIAPIVESLGRNMTFTGRTDIWDQINASTVNPLVGAGFWNFWGGPGGLAIELAMHTSVPNAHCGYVDLYLDGGVIGLILLYILLSTCGMRIIRYLKRSADEDRFLRVRFAFLIIAIIYNLSETAWFRVSFIWCTVLMMIVTFPPKTVATSPTLRSHPRDEVEAKHKAGAQPRMSYR